jgi:lysozyme
LITPSDPALIAMVSQHEGLRLKPYRDSVGIWTIGYGRNLQDVGIRQDEARLMLENDLTVAMNDARFLFDDFAALTPNRQRVLVDMAFNLGRTRLAGFKAMWAALERGDYHAAAAEMKDSRWARQVGNRADRLARMMKEG